MPDSVETVSTSVSALSEEWDIPERAVRSAGQQLTAVAIIKGVIEVAPEDLSVFQETAESHFTANT